MQRGIQQPLHLTCHSHLNLQLHHTHTPHTFLEHLQPNLTFTLYVSLMQARPTRDKMESSPETAKTMLHISLEEN